MEAIVLNPSTLVIVVVVVMSVSIAFIFAALIGLTVTLFSHVNGASGASALRAGAATLTAALTFSLGALALVAGSLH